jgi:hypothetical protein
VDERAESETVSPAAREVSDLDLRILLKPDDQRGKLDFSLAASIQPINSTQDLRIFMPGKVRIYEHLVIPKVQQRRRKRRHKH